MSSQCHCQCLLFVVYKEENSGSRTILALIPSAFSTEIITVFEQIDVRIMSMDNLQLLSEDAHINVIEILSDESSEESVDPFTIYVDPIEKELVQLMFPNIPVESAYSNSVVRSAVDDTNSEIVRALFRHRTDLGCRCQSISLLHLAVRRGHEYFARLLLECGAPIDSLDGHINTPLHVATCFDHPAVVRLFAQRGATINQKGIFGYMPLDSAVRFKRSKETIETLLQNGADPNILRPKLGTTVIFDAVGDGQIEVLQILCQYGARIDVKDTNRISLLEHALNCNYTAVFKFLLENFFTDPAQLKKIKIHRAFEKIYFGRRVFSGSMNTFVNACDILARHTTKIVTLGIRTSVEFEKIFFVRWSLTGAVIKWGITNSTESIRKFKSECENEIITLKRSLFPSGVSWYNILSSDVPEVVRIWKRESVEQTFDFNRLEELYPIYGGMLKNHLQKANLRKSLQEDGIKMCNFLSWGFEKLPLEIQEMIISYLSDRDIHILKGIFVYHLKPHA